MSTESSTSPPEEADPADLPPGYFVEDGTGAWLTLPWPGRLEELPPSLFPAIARWCRGDPVVGVPGVPGSRLIHHLTSEPWRFTRDQARFLHLWYALRPDGRWLYRSSVKRGAKGTGKDPFCAANVLIEAAGPCRFAGWDDRGHPIGVPQRMALVQIAANSEAQARDVLRVANGMVSDDFRYEHAIDAGIKRTNFGSTGATIELLTASEKSSEGDPATAIFLNETHHMTHTSGGQALAAVARRNVGKSPGGLARVMELTNAHMPGEESVAEDSYDAWQLQIGDRTRRKDILYDSREAPAHLSLHEEDQLMAGLRAAYADSPWSDLERQRDEAQDPRVPAADSIRYYFNSLPTNETAWVDPRKFDALARPTTIVADKDSIALFLDCSKSEDATVLCACRISDGHVFAIRGWQRPHGDRGAGWLAPRHEVDAAVRLTFASFTVEWFGVDPSPAREDATEAQYWGELVDEWHRDFREKVLVWATPGPTGSAVSFDMRMSTPGGQERNRIFTDMAMRTAAVIDEIDPDGDVVLDEQDQTFTWDGDPMLRTHVHNARRRPNRWGVSLGKRTRDSKQLVDFAVAMVGARLGRRLVLNSGKKAKRRTGRVY